MGNDIISFYSECQRLTQYKAYVFWEYGKQRQIDCDLAVKHGLFERVELPKPKVFQEGTEKLAQFDFIYNRVGNPLDGANVIAPDTRVPNYSTQLEDALEIAIVSEMKTLRVPDVGGREGIDDLISQITS